MAQKGTRAAKAAAPPARPRRGLRIAAIVLGVLAAVVGVLYLMNDEPRPHGRRGGPAETMARALVDSVNGDAWDTTGAVKFVFRHRNEHLWDRQRHYDRVRWGDVEVLLRVDEQTGIAREGGRLVHGDRAAELVKQAYAAWTNDTFWLNPLAKFFDRGATRAIAVGDDGVQRLLVSYESGGLTPGDAYLWTPGRGAPPEEWKMWVHVFPIGGVRATWERWVTLATGAKISTLHHIGPITVELSRVEGAGTIYGLAGDRDPFRAIVIADGRSDDLPHFGPGPATGEPPQGPLRPSMPSRP